MNDRSRPGFRAFLALSSPELVRRLIRSACLSSTYDKRGDRRSRIVLDLTPGNVVTTPRTDVMYVVTEFGRVNLKGKTVPERAKAMISLAHPDFRDDLERQARHHGLIPRSQF